MSLRRRGTKDLLRDLPLFADSPADELALVAELADVVTVAEGHDLIHEGHGGGMFTVMVEGTADVHVGDTHVRTLGPGDYLGEIAMVVGGRSTATVTATSPVRAVTLSRSDFERVLGQSPALRAKVQHTAWERLQGSPEGTGAS
jgi:CRP-like cAMP-binding protein